MIVMHSAVRALPGYNRHEVPSILMDGNSLDRTTEHGRAVSAQLARRQDTLDDAIEAASQGLAAAGVPRGVRRQARAAAEDYFYERLALAGDTPLDFRREPPHASLEPMPEGMYRALEDVVELVVDGKYADLHELSRGRLAVEDLHRRIEDDCPAALALPPREHYLVEAISKLDEPGEAGWQYFLDLWTEDGLAELHIEGELEESGERFEVTLDDIGP
jgi:hypothetical protein